MESEGERLKNYLKENGINQEDFANMIGVSRGYLVSVLLNRNEIPKKYKAKMAGKVSNDLFKSNNNVITQSYKSDTSNQNEKEVEYLKAMLTVKDELIEVLRSQVKELKEKLPPPINDKG